MFLVTLMDICDTDIKLKLKNFSSGGYLLFSKELLRNSRKYLSTQVKASRDQGFPVVLTLAKRTNKISP